MKEKHVALISVATAFSLLVFLLSVFIAPCDAFSIKRNAAQGAKLCCGVATSSSIFLVETKPSVDSFDTSAFLSPNVLPLILQGQSDNTFNKKTVILSGVPRPIWLLNRSILI
ncbi:MAG: hypothetical protein C0507_19980 [Cyanobacteria bacterium PR.3.49]|nr:hypothetical protein [Cyanobacteria bacterium PR.3.49]